MLPSQKTGVAQQKFTRYKLSRKCRGNWVGPESRNEHPTQANDPDSHILQCCPLPLLGVTPLGVWVVAGRALKIDDGERRIRMSLVCMWFRSYINAN